MPHAFAAKADRTTGLHATAHVEALGTPLETHLTQEQLAGMTLYELGDWSALRGSDLWCELHDIDRIRAGVPHALGGGLLSLSAFVGGPHAIAVNLSRTLQTSGVDYGTVAHVATLHFVCPLCSFGQQGTPHGVAAVWAASYSGNAVAASDDGIINASATDDEKEPVLAALREAIAAFNANPVDGTTGDHAVAVRDVFHWTIRAAANQYHKSQADDSEAGKAAEQSLIHAQSARTTGNAPSAAHHDANHITAEVLREMEHEAHLAISHGFAAAIKWVDPAIATTAVADVAAGMAARFNVPIRIVRVDARLPPHVERALVEHEERRKAAETHRVVTIVGITLAAAVGAFMVGYHGMNAVRNWTNNRNADGTLHVRARKLKRKNSDMVTGTMPASDKHSGISMMATTSEHAGTGTPGNTPRRVEQGGVLSPRN